MKKNPGFRFDEYTQLRQQDAPGWERHKKSLLDQMPARLPLENGKTLIEVFVEGYDDIPFWRKIFDKFETPRRTFEIGVPGREDLAKGKKVLIGMLPASTPHKIMCVDSDFDYLFGEGTEQSRIVNGATYMFHTYAYSTENFLCYAPSLHNVCVRATKNDARIFDFVHFMKEYSRIIYPLFIWYSFSAHHATENVFTLIDFKSSVKLNYLEVENNGRGTLEWLRRQVRKREANLLKHYPGKETELKAFEKTLAAKGLTRDTTYLFMQGHTLLDNVVMVMLNAVCERLKLMSSIRISTSTKTGTALRNEVSNYNNSLRNIRDCLMDNESYEDCPQYKKLLSDVRSYVKSL